MAEQIRKLAEQSAQSAVDTRTLIEGRCAKLMMVILQQKAQRVQLKK